MDLLTLFAYVGIAGIGAITTVILAMIRNSSAKKWKDEAKYWEEQAKTWKARHNAKAKSVIQLEDSYQVTGEEDAPLAMGAVVDAVLPMLPEGVRKYIKNPQVMDMVVSFAAKNPKLVNSILGGLTKKSSNGQTSTTNQFENASDFA